MSDDIFDSTVQMPGNDLDAAKMPAHWLFARIGKQVLRPGGRILTDSLLDTLDIGSSDQLVEMAPGLGATTKLLLSRHPAMYTGIERDRDAAHIVQKILSRPQDSCTVGTAQATGLDANCATVVFGEAYITMQPESTKREILAEIFRILEPGGRFGIHELALFPDDMPTAQQNAIRSDLVATLRLGARPLTNADWRQLIEDSGFTVEYQTMVPFRLLTPQRLVDDEGLARAAQILATAATDSAVRGRMKEIRECFIAHEQDLRAVGMVARKPRAMV